MSGNQNTETQKAELMKAFTEHAKTLRRHLSTYNRETEDLFLQEIKALLYKKIDCLICCASVAECNFKKTIKIKHDFIIPNGSINYLLETRELTFKHSGNVCPFNTEICEQCLTELYKVQKLKIHFTRSKYILCPFCKCEVTLVGDLNDELETDSDEEEEAEPEQAPPAPIQEAEQDAEQEPEEEAEEEPAQNLTTYENYVQYGTLHGELIKKPRLANHSIIYYFKNSYSDRTIWRNSNGSLMCKSFDGDNFLYSYGKLIACKGGNNNGLDYKVFNFTANTIFFNGEAVESRGFISMATSQHIGLLKD